MPQDILQFIEKKSLKRSGQMRSSCKRLKKRKTKIVVIPVSKDYEEDYLFDMVFKLLEPGIKTVNAYGINYTHENPWTDEHIWSAKIIEEAVYGVGIGAIGRINTCENAIRLGLKPKVLVTSKCFTSMALYYVFRVARLVQREFVYTKNFEQWINNWISEKVVNSRMIEYEGLSNDTP